MNESQGAFACQPTLNAPKLKKVKGIDYVLSWKSNGLFNSELEPLYTAFVHSIKHSRYRIGIKFKKDPLAVEQNNYSIKIVKVYKALDPWPKNTINNLKFKKCLFGVTNMIKSCDKEKCVCSVYEITFHSTGS